MKFYIVVLSIFSLLYCAPALAQSKKELAAQNAALAKRLSVLEKRMLTGDPAAERLIQRMDGLETSQRNLTGEIERLRFERDSLRGELTALIEDMAALQSLSSRMKVHLDAVDLIAKEQSSRFYSSVPVSGMGGQGGVNSPESNISQSNGANSISQVPAAPTFKEVTIPVVDDYNEMSKLPEQGKQKMAEGDFQGAQANFKQYLEFNPDASDAGDVNFWLAELYFVKGGYADAADHYIASMRKAPKGAKAPDAMIGLAATLRALGKTAEACQALASFPGQYPNAPARVREKARVEAARTGC